MEQQNEKKDIHATTSDLQGLAGLIESATRKFKTLAYFLVLIPLFFIICLSVAISLTPTLALLQFIWMSSQELSLLLRSFLLASGIAVGYYTYGLVLIFVIPLFNAPILPFVKKQRATWFSLSVIPWMYHNALTYIVRFTFLEMVTPTPLTTLFYRMMGMKIGKGTMINTTNISDPCLIKIGNYTTIGGSATIIAHYGMKGFLIVDQVEIGDEVVLGLKSTVFGNVRIEDRAQVGPHEVVLPKSVVTANPENENL